MFWNGMIFFVNLELLASIQWLGVAHNLQYNDFPLSPFFLGQKLF